jgi:hypothetical protein
MAGAGARSTAIVVGAAVCGVLAACGLAFGPLGLADDLALQAPPSTTSPTRGSSAESAPAADEPRAGAGRAAASDDSSPVTVETPESERPTTPGLRPDPAPPAGDDPPSQPAVPLSDPQAVAGAYVVAAESVTSDDAGRRHHRASVYMAPTNPARTTGLLVTDAPPAGRWRVVTVVWVAEHARNDDLGRIAYQVAYQRHLSPTTPSGALVSEGETRATYVVVERQPDGDWLVLSQADQLDPVE